MKTTELPEDVLKILEKWKDKKGNLIMILHALQNHYGYVPLEEAYKLSKVLGVPLARIYEVLTFYNYFKLLPPGKHKIALCMGTACYLKGAPDILSLIKNTLEVEEGHTTKDGLFHLDLVRCIGCCGLAPVVLVDDKVHSKITRKEMRDIINKITKEG
jgi:NADH-quinone oxidoreductase subunit E